MKQEAGKYGDTEIYQRSRMQKERIIQTLKERGCRITRQRKRLIDLIMENEYSCCKEIYYQAVQEDGSIGMATVYRMVKILEEIGAISRNNMYTISRENEQEGCPACTIELEDHTEIALSGEQWHQVVKRGLSACGYAADQNVRCVSLGTEIQKKPADNDKVFH